MLLIHGVGSVTDVMCPSLTYLSSCSFTLAFKATGTFEVHSALATRCCQAQIESLPGQTRWVIKQSLKLQTSCCFVRGVSGHSTSLWSSSGMVNFISPSADTCHLKVVALDRLLHFED
ncbi:hypothetical protein QQF64_020520 [Cirrhinus molitorella]|uniref:Uncharacterized protein n=1 Tax=Cirrhinus molitorella TaxID=172907 RepID=A0ABR3L9D7_9TELE